MVYVTDIVTQESVYGLSLTWLLVRVYMVCVTDIVACESVYDVCR